MSVIAVIKEAIAGLMPQGFGKFLRVAMQACDRSQRSSPLVRRCHRERASILPRFFLSCVLALFVFAHGSVHGSCAALPRPVLGRGFLKRLLAPETRSDAFYELILRTEEGEAEPRWKNLPRRVFDDAMKDIRVTECPGRDGDAPLYLVTYKEDFQKWYEATHPTENSLINGFKAEDFYPPTAEEQRREGLWNANKGIPHLSKSSLSELISRPALDDKVLIFIDTGGQIQWPHGGGNMGGTGSLIADLNGDGVLERLDYTNYGFEDVRERHTAFQVLEVKTIEKNPRLLLAVVFNWHPESADAANRWWYESRVMPGDALPAIVLGPQPGEREGGAIEKPVVEYHWDKVAACYTGPAGKHGDHFRRLDVSKSDELWPKIQELQKEKTAGYPLLAEAPPHKTPGASASDVPARWPGGWTHWPKYEHHTLAAMSNEDLFHWQYGGGPETDWGLDPWPAVVFPPRLRELSPRDAALALAEANRTKAHREQYDLIVSSKTNPMPKDGVLVLDVHPGWSCPYQEFIRLDGKKTEWWMCKPVAFSGTLWSHRADTDGTMRWLAGVIAWLDRVRSVPRKALSPETGSGVGWDDVNRAGIVWQTQSDDRKALEYRTTEPQYAGRQWKGPYTRLVAQTLAVNLWMRTTSSWGEDERARIAGEEAVETLLPGKPRAFTGAERLLIKPAILSSGYAGWDRFRPQLEALADGQSIEAPEDRVVPSSLQPFARAALNEIDHRDDIPVLKSWASDYKRLEAKWAGMRLRQIEEAASKSTKEITEPPPAAITEGTKAVETWEELENAYLASFLKNRPSPLDLLVQRRGDCSRQLWDLMKQKFDGAQGGFRDEIATAYTAGLRNFAEEDLACLATTSPEEKEGTRFDCWGGESGGKPVDGRYHLARAILAVWNEPDALTRAKLLLVLGLKNADERRQIPGPFGDKIMDDLLAAAASLQASDRNRLTKFARWCATDAVGHIDDYPFTKSQAQWLADITQKVERALPD